MPVAEGNLAEIAATGNACRAALLLSPVDPVREAIIRNHVIELRGGLVVPRAPSLPAVHTNGCALVAGQRDDLRILGIDPNCVVVVAAGRALDGGEGCAGVS